jgi:hypothetical protein
MQSHHLIFYPPHPWHPFSKEVLKMHRESGSPDLPSPSKAVLGSTCSGQHTQVVPFWQLLWHLALTYEGCPACVGISLSLILTMCLIWHVWVQMCHLCGRIANSHGRGLAILCVESK